MQHQESNVGLLVLQMPHVFRGHALMQHQWEVIQIVRALNQDVFIMEKVGVYLEALGVFLMDILLMIQFVKISLEMEQLNAGKVLVDHVKIELVVITQDLILQLQNVILS